MANQSLATVLHCLHRMLGVRAMESLPDGDLLERFVQDGDQAAFAVLVRRHGRLVWNVSLRVLGDVHDAEDAFQATCLVLARKAKSIATPDLLGNWLHGVALRCAMKLKTQAAVRRVQERKAVAMLTDETAVAVEWQDLRPILDEEVNRLPLQYRAPVVLCYFEGKPYEEAARLLGCPAGTVSGRLARARQLLRDRLTRRGVTASASALTALLAEQAQAAVPSETLVAHAVEAGVLYATAPSAAAALVPAHVISLAEGVMQPMVTTKLKLLTALALALVVADAPALLPINAPAFQPVAAAQAPADSTATPANPVQEQLWTDLAAADEAKVMRAILALNKTPAETTAFIKQMLPAVKADPQRVKRLIGDLDSNQFATRRQAAEDLEYLGKYIKDDLEKALAAAQGLEMKERLQQLVDRFKPVAEPKLPPARAGGMSVQVTSVNGQQRIIINGVEFDPNRTAPAPVGPSMTWVRAVRAIALLEHLGTPEARAHLEVIASGETDALPTQQARAALDRLKK